MSEILLKAGTGEVEIIEFVVDNQYYAINVLKVKGIVQIDSITPLPQMTGAIAGLANVRGEMNIVIDLRKVLYRKRTEDYTKSLGLLCEFNETVIVFLVDKVEGIKRILWEDIKQTSQVQEDTLCIGSILDNEKIIIMLDFESITIASHIGRGYETQIEALEKGQVREKSQHIVIVEDSRAIGEMIKCSLTEAGYNNIELFHNGQDAKEYIFGLKSQLGDRFREKIDLLITDIEMPVLDGYTLTKYIKEDELLKSLKVIIFSSLITEELRHKGEAVGADVQISKPSMKELVMVVDKLIEDIQI